MNYVDIKTAINKQLNKARVNDKKINIQSRDVEEGFQRPSFFVRLDNAKRHNLLDQIGRSLAVDIYYFPSDEYEYSVEILEMQDKLEQLFDLKLEVEDRLLNVSEFEGVITDGVLKCSFDIEFEYGREEEDAELMEELYINQEED